MCTDMHVTNIGSGITEGGCHSSSPPPSPSLSSALKRVGYPFLAWRSRIASHCTHTCTLYCMGEYMHVICIKSVNICIMYACSYVNNYVFSYVFNMYCRYEYMHVICIKSVNICIMYACSYVNNYVFSYVFNMYCRYEYMHVICIIYICNLSCRYGYMEAVSTAVVPLYLYTMDVISQRHRTSSSSRCSIDSVCLDS